MISNAVIAIDGPMGVSKMSSEFRDDIKYLSVDPLNRRRYWRTGNSALNRNNTKPGLFAQWSAIATNIPDCSHHIQSIST